MDSDSDIEVVPNSVDDVEENHSLSSDSSTASVSSLPPSEATRKRVTQDHRSTTISTSSRLSTTTVFTAASTSTHSSLISNAMTASTTSKLPDASSSDIEIIAGPSSKRGAGTDLTNRIRGRSTPRLLSSSSGSKRGSLSSGRIGGFKSAAAILKEEAKREKKAAVAAAARRRSSSSASTSSDAAVSTNRLSTSKSRDVSPALSASSGSGSDIKGKKREESLPPSLLLSEKYRRDERRLEDEDDDIVELPPPSSMLQASTHTSSRKEDDDMELDVDGDAESSSPGAAFRNSINKFKAPAVPHTSRSGRSGSSNSRSSSLFAGRKDTGDRTASTGLTVLLDSSTASTSTSASTSNKRARSKFTATATTTSEPSTSSSMNTKRQQLEIPIPFLAVINRCPTCNDVWTVHKDPKIKLNHIRKCAISKAYYSFESVNELVEAQVRSLQAIAEERNRRTLDGRTLFEGVLSRKGKDVQVVGVEKKTKTSSSSLSKGKEVDTRNEEEGEDQDTFREVVLSTQGGSAYSQATSTQVQKELTKRIKTAQRIERGDFLNVPATGATASSSALIVRDAPSHSTSDGTGTGTGSDGQASSTTGNDTSNGTGGGKSALEEAVSKGRKKRGSANLSAGVGSKNWLKAAQLLKAKEKEAASMAALDREGDASLLSTSHMGGTSITSTLLASSTTATIKGKGRATSASASAAKNRLVSYQESRFRLAEKVKDIAASRTRSTTASTDSSDTSPSEAATASGAEAEKPTDMETAVSHDMISRPYRNPSELSYCLLDKAIQRGSEKEKQGYNAWNLAGSAEDTIKDRYVSENPSSPPPSSPPVQRYQPMSDSDACDPDIPAPLSRNTSYKRNQQQSSLPSSPILLDHRPSSPSANPPRYASPPSSPPIGKLSLSSPTSPRFPVYLHASDTAVYGHNHTRLDSTSPASAATTVNFTGNDSIDSGSSAAALHSREPLQTDNVPIHSSSNATNITFENSSNGLFKSSAALQILTQRLKTSKITTTSSSSTNPILARRAASAAAAAVTTSRATSLSASSMNSLPLLPSVLASPVQVLASTSASASSMSIRTFASVSVTHSVKSEQVEPLSPSSTEEKVKKPRGRPRKVPLEDGETSITAKASPKRKKKDATDSSPLSDTDEPLATAAKQGTLAFTATKKGKAVAKRAIKKKTDTDTSSPRKKKATAEGNVGTSVATTKFAPDYPGMPDYDSWSKEKLQAATGKYGYKPAGTKKVLISQLVRVWEVLHPELLPEQEKAESLPPWRARSRSASPKAAPAVKKTTKAATKKKAASESEDCDGTSDAPQSKPTSKKAASSPGKAKKPKSTKGKAIAAARAKRKAALSGSGSGSESDPDGEESHIHDFDEVGEEEVDTDTPPDELKSAGERLKEAIIKDEKFYMRILRYEPILFDDFEMILAATKIKMSKVALRDWLDSQGIIFYYDQSTGRNATRNGARKRHA